MPDLPICGDPEHRHSGPCSLWAKTDDGLCGARGQWRTDARAIELYRYGVQIIVSCDLPRGHDGDHQHTTGQTADEPATVGREAE